MNLQKTHILDLYQDIAQTPQYHIFINLQGPYSVTLQGNSYAMTAVCNHIGYLMNLASLEYYTLTMALNLNLNL